MKLEKYVYGSGKCDFWICETLLIARADPNACSINVMSLSQNAGIEINFEINKSALKIDKIISTIQCK